MKFDPTKPTSQMLGRFQPGHSGHTELFKKIHAENGQVIIMIWMFRRSTQQLTNFHNSLLKSRTEVNIRTTLD